MLARSFLFKLLTFIKSSRLVFVVALVFVNQSSLCNGHTRKTYPSSVNSKKPFSNEFKNSARLKASNPGSLQPFERQPTWPA